MTVRQCPRCELRFEREAELKAHLIDDHEVEPETLEADLVYPRPPDRGDESADDAVVTDTDR